MSSEIKYDGYLDNATPYKLIGWAADMNDFSAHAEVEFLLDGSVVGRTICRSFREDLLQAGVGTGDHAFCYTFDSPLPSSPALQFAVRIAGTDIQLKNSPWPYPLQRGFDIIAADITDNCNLRCPFCLYDYSNVKTTHKMTRGTFAKLIDLSQYVGEGQFFVSCLHEPTLHPEFLDFLEMIPGHLRQKAFFTTNNCRRLTDDYFSRLANTNIHHVNVSFDTLKPDFFSFLRKGGNNEVFMENNRRMADAFSKNPRAPKLRFIIMAFKSNAAEIPALIKFCHDEYGADDVEVRYTFEMPHISTEFYQQHVMNRADWAAFEKTLSEVTQQYTLMLPPEYYDPLPAGGRKIHSLSDMEAVTTYPPPQPIQLRVSWDGTMQVIGWEKHFKVNINMLRDPYATLISI
ncbi:MAG: radical SAM protein [Bacteroidales bacterium]|jgi:molybdenum cofactor biosynthesis enzyme MoaA|nr:radical SAM protein [Bacteroidales bacterium]MDD4213852.1 radical SAM protein [Bacteroidales bacterium]